MRDDELGMWPGNSARILLSLVSVKLLLKTQNFVRSN